MSGVVLIFASLLCAGRAFTAPGHRPSDASLAPTEPNMRVTLSAWLGATIRTRMGRPPDPAVDRALGRGLVITAVAGVVSIQLGLLVAMLAVIHTILAKRAAAQQRRRAIVDELPELIDLYAVALRSGRNVTAATREVTTHTVGPVAHALRACLDRSAGGRPLIDELAALTGALGPATRPLVAALIDSDRHGAAISDHLAVLATDARLRRRREAETRARRVPVKLLFPLVFCILPAFLLLTVVPVLVEAVSVLDT